MTYCLLVSCPVYKENQEILTFDLAMHTIVANTTVHGTIQLIALALGICTRYDK